MFSRLTAALGALALAATMFFVATAPAGAVLPDTMIVHSYSSSSWVGDLTGTVVPALTATGAFGTITVFDAYKGRGGTPTWADLAGIELVIVSSGDDFADAAALGNLLAAFVDGGGRVIEATYSFACPNIGTNGSEWGIGGRWETGGYSPLVGPTASPCDGYTWVGGADGVVDVPGSPYVTGVTPPFGTPVGQNAMNRNIVAVRDSATSIMSWSDGNALFAVGTNCVVGINIWPPDMPAFTDSTSAYQLFANAASVPCTPAGAQAPTTPAPIVQPAYTG